MILTAFVVALLAVAVCVATANWAWAYLSERNCRRGIDKRYSMLPLVSQVLVGLAWFIHAPDFRPWFGATGFILVAVIDPSLWSLFVFFIRRLLLTQKR